MDYTRHRAEDFYLERNNTDKYNSYSNSKLNFNSTAPHFHTEKSTPTSQNEQDKIISEDVVRRGFEEFFYETAVENRYAEQDRRQEKLVNRYNQDLLRNSGLATNPLDCPLMEAENRDGSISPGRFIKSRESYRYIDDGKDRSPPALPLIQPLVQRYEDFACQGHVQSMPVPLKHDISFEEFKVKPSSTWHVDPSPLTEIDETQSAFQMPSTLRANSFSRILEPNGEKKSSVLKNKASHESQRKPKRRKSSKRRVDGVDSNGNVVLDTSKITWEDLNIDEAVWEVVHSVLTKDQVGNFLNDTENIIYGNIQSTLTPEQRQAFKVVKQRLRAEKKSRREKHRRVHVNNSLVLLARTINIDPDEKDMNSILRNAIDFVKQQKVEIQKLNALLDRQDREDRRKSFTSTEKNQ